MSDTRATISIETAIDQIRVGQRLRPISEATVQALLHVIDEYGFTVPILVRGHRGGLDLIDGAHRLEAMRRRGETSIAAIIKQCRADEAAALEVSQNLAGAAMSPLDDALFLAAYSEAYQRLHPETKGGVAGALAKHGHAAELSSFAAVMAEKRAITPRQVRKITAAGRRIDRAEADLLRSSGFTLTLKDIEDLGKINDPDLRARVVQKIGLGAAKKVSIARRQIAEEDGTVEAPVKDPVEAQFQALAGAWQRASAAVRRRFFHEFSDDIAAMEGGAE